MFYPREVIEEVNRRTPIEELMHEEGETIFGRGRTLSFLCSRCNGDLENSKINTEKNFFKCYRCEDVLGQSYKGQPVNYIQLKYGYTLPQAVEYLANRVGMELPRGTLSKEEKEKLNLYRETMRFYEQFWQESDYLLKRGVSERVIRKYRIGYTPTNASLRDHLMSKGYDMNTLVRYNLVKETGIDRFFGRCIVPLTQNDFPYDFYTRRIDHSDFLKHLPLHGKFIAFGADAIRQEAENLDLFESVINKLVTESHGYTDSMGIGGCTKFEEAHLSMIKRKNPKCVRIIFDPDRKGQGQKAALMVGAKIAAAGIPVKVVLLPIGKDAADLLANGEKGLYQQCLDEAMDYSVFRAHFLMKSMPIDIIEQHLEWRKEPCLSSHHRSFTTLFWESLHS